MRRRVGQRSLVLSLPPLTVDKVILLCYIDSMLGAIEYTSPGDAPAIEDGVVVPAHERIDPRVGRAILKYISHRYVLLKNKPDSKDV